MDNCDHLEIELADLAATQKLGQSLAQAILEADACCIFSLSGQLGAGKTTLVKAIGNGLGVSELIASPTFTMMNEYHTGKVPLYHFDFYRIGETMEMTGTSPSLDMLSLEFEEVTSARVAVMIEWPEFFIVGDELYLTDLDHLSLELKLAPGSETRLLTLCSNGELSSRLLNSFKTCSNKGV